MNQDQARSNMIEQQVRPWDVLDPRTLDTMANIRREDFCPEQYKSIAYTDTHIPLGEDQTMTAPRVIGRILQAVQVQKDESALEIGTGSGYLTACLATLAKSVDSVEISAAIHQAAQKNLDKFNAKNINLSFGDASKGWHPEKNEYDVIVLDSCIPEYDEHFEKQLTIGGRLFMLVGNAPIIEALLITRLGDNEFSTTSLFETEACPLIGISRTEEFIF